MEAAPHESPRRTLPVWALLVLLVLQGIGGTFGGLMLTTDPTGESLQVPPGMLDGSPFPDYFIPGLILLILLGILPFVTAAGLLARQAWAWFGAFAIGCALVIFELVEIWAVGYNFQQPIWGTVGALIALVSLLPSVQRYAGLSWGRRLPT